MKKFPTFFVDLTVNRIFCEIYILGLAIIGILFVVCLGYMNFELVLLISVLFKITFLRLSFPFSSPKYANFLNAYINVILKILGKDTVVAKNFKEGYRGYK